jgi:KipI family sensor histidine kinase inhibitor
LSYPRVLPVGDAAATLELGDSIDATLNARVRAADAALQERPFTGLLECAPAYRSLLVRFEPRLLAFDGVREELLRVAQAATACQPASPRRHALPVCYGGEHGPDLARVAARHGLSPADVVRLHAAPEYTAFLLGFMAGFAYLGILDQRLETPRIPTPRTRVPVGSVGIAARQTGVYPISSPGGWNLIGRTAARLFDPYAPRVTLIEPGDVVRFEPVAELEEAPVPADEPLVTREPAFELLAPGLLTTVQDLGRTGQRRRGIGGAGAADRASFLLANRALANDEGAAALECTVSGPTLRFLRPVRFALAGADLGALLQRDDLGAWPVPHGRSVLARPGNVLSFAGRRSGCRGYVAFAGGLDVPLMLGSRATDLGSGFGGLQGRPLRQGDVLGALDNRREPPALAPGAPGVAGDSARVRVVLGPQQQAFTQAALEAFLGESWNVGATSDRIGCRLQGPKLEHAGAKEIVADGMVPGCIQVPPDGQPIVMLADCPSTGGYPKIATVVSADLGKLAQLLPGQGCVRFEVVPEQEAT